MTPFGNRCDFVLRHCDAPMRWLTSRYTWETRPPVGVTDMRLQCDTCHAVLTMRLAEPSKEATCSDGGTPDSAASNASITTGLPAQPGSSPD